MCAARRKHAARARMLRQNCPNVNWFCFMLWPPFCMASGFFSLKGGQKDGWLHHRGRENVFERHDLQVQKSLSRWRGISARGMSRAWDEGRRTPSLEEIPWGRFPWKRTKKLRVSLLTALCEPSTLVGASFLLPATEGYPLCDSGIADNHSFPCCCTLARFCFVQRAGDFTFVNQKLVVIILPILVQKCREGQFSLQI